MRTRRAVAIAILLMVAAVGLHGSPAAGDRDTTAIRAFQAGLVTVGFRHACVVVTTQGARCWGTGTFGRTGYNATANVGDGVGLSIATAGDVPTGGDVASISAGGAHTCAVLTTRKARCWGRSDEGQLGYNSNASVGDSNATTIVAAGDVPVGGDVEAISAGGAHTCALLTDAQVRCWGRGGEGQLGYNSANKVGAAPGIGVSSIIAAGNVPVGGDVRSISAGDAHSCALLTTGRVRCWGENNHGQLGLNLSSSTRVGDGTAPSIIAAGDVPVGGDVAAISAGGFHTCALLTNGKVRCWGQGTDGELGFNNTADVGLDTGPTIATAGDVPIGADAVAISSGFDHTCALLANAKVRCWGLGDFGRLGYNSGSRVGNGVGPSIITAGDVPLGGDAVVIRAGDGGTCALLTTGRLRCWGTGVDGRTGYNNTADIGDHPSRPIASDVPIGADLFGQVADVSLGVAPATLDAEVGDGVTVTITVSNAGPDPATGVTASAPIPAGLTLVSATPSQGNYVSEIWTVGTLATGASATLTLKVSATEAGARTIVGEVGSSAAKDLDSTPGNAAAGEDDRGSSTITATTVISNPPSTPTPTATATVIPTPTAAATATATPTPRCTVPKLKRKSLAAAKKALTKARCKLGKVKKPSGRLARNRKLVVNTTSPKAGVSKPLNTKVNLTLRRVKR